MNSELDEAEGWVSDLEDRKKETPNQSRKKRIKKNEDSLRDLGDNMRHNNIHIIGILEGEERKQGTNKLVEEIMTKNCANLLKEKDTQTQKV